MQFYENKLRKYFVISRHTALLLRHISLLPKSYCKVPKPKKLFSCAMKCSIGFFENFGSSTFLFCIHINSSRIISPREPTFVYSRSSSVSFFPRQASIIIYVSYKFLLDKGRLPLASARKRSFATPSSGLKRRPQRPLEQFLKTVCPAFHNSPVLHQ